MRVGPVRVDPDWPIPPPGCDGPATYEIGVGESAFLPVTEGAPLPIHCGLQGGYHAVTAIRRCGGSGPVRLRTRLLRASDDAVVGGAVYPPVDLLPEAEACCASLSNIWSYLEPIGGLRPPDALDGEGVVVEFTITDTDDVEHVATAHFTAVEDDDCAVDTADPP